MVKNASSRLYAARAMYCVFQNSKEASYSMYIPLQLRLTLFYALLLGLALWFFGNAVSTQAQQRAYHDLDTALSSRAASVNLGKSLLVSQNSNDFPLYLNNSINGLGAGDIAIEVFDTNLRLLATTIYSRSDPTQPSVAGAAISPIPWDAQTARSVEQRYSTCLLYTSPSPRD